MNPWPGRAVQRVEQQQGRHRSRDAQPGLQGQGEHQVDPAGVGFYYQDLERGGNHHM